VNLMGGRIAVESTQGAGATFHFDLDFALSGQPEATLVAPPELAGARVLVVDDSALARAILREALAARLSEGMQDYLTKPVDPEKLYATLARWIGKALPARAVLPAADLAPLPGLAGIDSSFGLRNVGGNSALYVELLDRFRAAQRAAGCTIRSDLDAGRLREAASRAFRPRSPTRTSSCWSSRRRSTTSARPPFPTTSCASRASSIRKSSR
jgi:hypothetical protein